MASVEITVISPWEGRTQTTDQIIQGGIITDRKGYMHNNTPCFKVTFTSERPDIIERLDAAVREGNVLWYSIPWTDLRLLNLGKHAEYDYIVWQLEGVNPTNGHDTNILIFTYSADRNCDFRHNEKGRMVATRFFKMPLTEEAYYMAGSEAWA